MSNDEPNEFRHRISTALKARAVEMRMDYVYLGNAVGCDRKTIARCMNGHSGSDRFLDATCKALKWKVTDLLLTASIVSNVEVDHG